MAEERYPSAIDIEGAEIAIKRETATKGELAALKSRLEDLDMEAMQCTGLLDLYDEIGQQCSDESDGGATPQSA